jgi:aldehyde dehydrogenase (NAD+)
MNFGQTCHAGTRIYVHEDIYDDFVSAYVKRMSSLKVGDNFNPETDQGPQNSRMQYEKILDYIKSGQQEGATLVAGGRAVRTEGAAEGGYFIEPTVFTDVKPDMKVSSKF